jgi:AcrR family transcriptional regulator
LAILVNKTNKRKMIALKCTDILLEKGIKKLTVSKIAETAEVAKGSIYDYFKNKEDIVFEIAKNYIQEYQKELILHINSKVTVREKLISIFELLLHNNSKYQTYHIIYKEYISINLDENNDDMCNFNTICTSFLKDILITVVNEGIKNGELKKESLNLVEGLIATERGFLLIMWTEQRDIKEGLTKFLNTLFDLIEIKNEI